MLRKIISTLLAVLMLVSVIPMSVVSAYAEEVSASENDISAHSEIAETSAETEPDESDTSHDTNRSGNSIDDSSDNQLETKPVRLADLEIASTGEGSVTRVEWLTSLTKTFNMTVEDDNYPDNYFADLSVDDEYYYNVLLAVEFGVIDIEAGGKVYPTQPADRDFVASTLNHCLGFKPEEDVTYTFSDADDVTHKDDAQIAIDKGWFKLIDGKFMPAQAVTSAEATALLDEAKSIIEESQIDENYDSTYNFDNSVKVVPKGTPVTVGDTTVTIENYTSINEGDSFAVFATDIPSIYTALSVTTEGSTTTITVAEGEELSEDLVEADAQGSEELYESYIMPAEGVELDYEYEDEELYSDDLAPTGASGTKKIKGINAKWGPIKIKFKNLKVKYIVDTFNKHFLAELDGDADISFSASTKEIRKLLGGDDMTLDILSYKIPGVGKAGIFIYAGIDGEISVNYDVDFSTGFEYTGYGGFRSLNTFEKKNFSISMDVELNVGIMASVDINIMGVLKGSIWARAGFKASLSLKVYPEGKKPHECRTFSAYIYADMGFSASLSCFGFSKKESVTYTIYDERNSPVRLYYHYEDGKPVANCSNGLGYYYTPSSSRYGYCTYGGGYSAGYDISGKPFTIFKYDLDDNNNAVITSYEGNVASLSIPGTIDGHEVVGIGKRAFMKNGLIKNVIIPDSVTYIGNEAFTGCANLRSVELSENIIEIGTEAFADCDSLTSIEIPKSLEITCRGYTSRGVFTGSDNLKTVTFEEGVTRIAQSLFSNSALEEIKLPDTITSIDNEAFFNSKQLRSVVLPASLTKIGNRAFENCIMIEMVEIPDTVTYIGDRAFNGCESLKSLDISDNIKEIGIEAFANCDSLTSIEIPKSLEITCKNYTSRGVFTGSDNLKTITFEEGVTRIAQSLFSNSVLEEIKLPDTIVSIDNEAFFNSKQLRSVVLPDSLTKIGNRAFENCNMIETVDIPDTVTYIGERAFNGCESLKSLDISNSIKEIGVEAFANCDSLTSIEIPKSLEITCRSNTSRGVFTDSDNLKTVTFEEGTTKLVRCLFANSSIEKIEIPNTVDTIEERVFFNAGLLSYVKIPESVTSIKDYVFYKCASLEDLKLPDNLQMIPSNTFNGCSSLNKIEFSDKVSEIGNSAFAGCSSLESIPWTNTITVIGNSSFDGSGIKEFIAPVRLKSIGSYAFNNCDALTDVTLPQSLQTLVSSAFANCEVLNNVKFADYSISKIESSTFSDDPALKSIVIPKGCKEIKDNAFKNCTSLTEVTIPESVTSIADSAFSYPAKMTIYGYTDSYAKEYADKKGIKFVDNHILSEGLALSEKFDNFYDEATETYNFVLDYGDSMTFDFDFYPTDSNDCVTLSSNNKNVKTDMLTVTANSISGDSVVTATATGGATFEFNVHVRHVQNIELTSLPEKLIYINGEALDLKGLEVKVNYNDKTSEIAKEGQYTVTGFDPNTNAKQTLTVTFTAKNGSAFRKTFDVEVVDPLGHLTGIAIIKLPNKMKYLRGEGFDKTGLTVAEIYDSGAQSEITDYSVSGYNALKIGKQTITVKKGDYSATFKITVYKDSIPEGPYTDDIKDDETNIVVTVADNDILDKLKVDIVDKKEVNSFIVGDKMAVYDISLTKNNVEIQPENTVTVRIPCDNPDAKVYRVEEGNDLTDMNAVYEDGYMVFTTEHFSVYILSAENGKLGDVDGDDEVMITDATFIQRKIANIEIPYIFTKAIADVDKDGEVSVMDATFIQSWLSSLMSDYFIGKPIH